MRAILPALAILSAVVAGCTVPVPGLDSAGLPARDITALEALALAQPRGAAWQADAALAGVVAVEGQAGGLGDLADLLPLGNAALRVVLPLPGDDATGDGRAEYWTVVFGSPSTEDVLAVTVGPGGVVNATALPLPADLREAGAAAPAWVRPASWTVDSDRAVTLAKALGNFSAALERPGASLVLLLTGAADEPAVETSFSGGHAPAALAEAAALAERLGHGPLWALVAGTAPRDLGTNATQPSSWEEAAAHLPQVVLVNAQTGTLVDFTAVLTAMMKAVMEGFRGAFTPDDGGFSWDGEGGWRGDGNPYVLPCPEPPERLADADVVTRLEGNVSSGRDRDWPAPHQLPTDAFHRRAEVVLQWTAPEVNLSVTNAGFPQMMPFHDGSDEPAFRPPAAPTEVDRAPGKWQGVFDEPTRLALGVAAEGNLGQPVRYTLEVRQVYQPPGVVSALQAVVPARDRAQAWQPDAVLTAVTGEEATGRSGAFHFASNFGGADSSFRFPPEPNPGDGRSTRWVFQFYSPSQQLAVDLAVDADGRVLVDEEPSRVRVAPVEGWTIDSSAVAARAREHPQVDAQVAASDGSMQFLLTMRTPPGGGPAVPVWQVEAWGTVAAEEGADCQTLGFSTPILRFDARSGEPYGP